MDNVLVSSAQSDQRRPAISHDAKPSAPTPRYGQPIVSDRGQQQPHLSLGVGVEILVCRGDPVHPVGHIPPHQSEASKSSPKHQNRPPAPRVGVCPRGVHTEARRRRRSLSQPHISQFDRDAIDYRPLVDDDRTADMTTALAYSGVGAPGGSGTFLGDRSRPAPASTTTSSSTITCCRRSGTASSARSNPRTSATGTPRHWSAGRRCGRTPTACCGPSSRRSPSSVCSPPRCLKG